MQVKTIDPISGEKVTNIYAPFVVEGHGDDVLKIYFSSDANRKAYCYINRLLSRHAIRNCR